MTRNVTLAFLLIALALTFAFTLPLSQVKAVNVEIASVTPASRRGKVGDSVNIVGAINTTDGSYQIFLGSKIVFNGSATGNNVNATFSVPPTPTGNYTLVLHDVDTSVDAITWFYVNTAQYLKVITPTPPLQLQENSTVTILANVTGGRADRPYSANVTVKSPANSTSWVLANFTTSAIGSGNVSVVYPNDFRPLGTHTNYTGTYTVAFNKTQAVSTFFVGLTNLTEYHRFQYVGVRASDYKPLENVTVKILFGANVIHSETVNATAEGLVYANWLVNSTASMETYTLNVTSTLSNGTRKTPRDVQTFTVPGFSVNATARNLAQEPVFGVTLRISENGKSTENVTSDVTGVAHLKLEIGNYTGEAYFKGQKVGARSINVTGAATLDFLCNLTNLRIIVIDDAGLFIPEVTIFLKPDNESATTNVTGTAIFHSVLPSVTYSLNVSRYGVSFNLTTVPNLPAVAWFNLTITCPTLRLQVDVTDANDHPISNVAVEVQELIGGPSYKGNTTGDGIVVFNRTFGKYSIKVYDVSGIKLNETTVDLFQNQNITLRCRLYGLTLSVRVIDFFGQPIANTNVTLQREGQATLSSLTAADGTATFNNIVGGDFQAAVYLSGQTQPSVAQSIFVDKSATIDIKIDKFVVLAGFFVETGQLATAIIIALTVVLVLVLEVYRRRRLKHQKSAS